MTPFVVFSLPRSRSAWLSVFLSSPDDPVAHDIGPTVDTPDEFISRLSDHAGTCETGAAFAWPLIRRALPDARFLVVWRDPSEVAASLARFGFADLDAELKRRVDDMNEIVRAGAQAVTFEDLRSESVCANVYRYCTGRDMPRDWWRALDALNIQVDMERQLRLLIERAPKIEALKAEVRARV